MKRRNQRRRRSRTPARVTVEATTNGKSLGENSRVAKSPNTEAGNGSPQGTSGHISIHKEGLTLGMGQPLLQGESSEVKNGDEPIAASSIFVHYQPAYSEESEVEEDSSDVSSSDPDEQVFEKVVSKRHRKALRGKCLKTSS